MLKKEKPTHRIRVEIEQLCIFRIERRLDDCDVEIISERILIDKAFSYDEPDGSRRVFILPEGSLVIIEPIK